MKLLAILSAGLIWAGFSPSSAQAQKMARQEFTANHAPLEVIRPALKKVLSPAGRFVILPGTGNVLVIDFPENVAAAGPALANLKVPPPQLALQVGVNTNVAPGAIGAQPVTSFGGFPFPTRYEPARIIPNGLGGVIVVPAHPTGFRKRDVGMKMDTTPTINPDGSINVDINVEHTEFEGFINYGSPIFTSGIPRAIPVLAGVRNPAFFAPFANANNIRVPIFSTTRISTSILVKPTVQADRVHLDMIPQLNIENPAEPGAEAIDVNLPQFRTPLELRNGRLGKIPGFKGASVDFNRNFLGAKDGEEGGTSIVFKAQIQAGKAAATPATEVTPDAETSEAHPATESTQAEAETAPEK